MGRHCYVLLTRRQDVPIRCRGDVSLRRPGNVPRKRRWVFHLRRNCNVAGTYRETLLRRHYDVLLPGGTKARMLAHCETQVRKIVEYSKISIEKIKAGNLHLV